MKPFLLFLILISQQIITNGQQSLSFQDAVDLMLQNNKAIKVAEKNTELAKRQSQMINASWFPTIAMTGTYTLMSN